MSYMRKIFLLITVVFVSMVCMDFGFAGEELFEKHELGTFKTQWVPGEIVVKFKEGVSEDSIRRINDKHGSFVLSMNKRGKFKRVRTRKDKTIKEMVNVYKQDPNVEYAEPNYIAYALMTPNDPYFKYQWNLDNSASGGIHAQSAWDIQPGGNPGVIVAVVDTGVAYEDYGTTYKKAPDLANTSFVAGYDFVNNDVHPNDDEGHGTHVTGTIAQSTNNGVGAAGVAFRVSIMPVKVLNSAGSGTYADIADGIYFAADHGAKVINLSLGGTSTSSVLENALAYAHNKGVTIVCAAGNEYQKGNPIVYPAAYDAYCIAVGAVRYDEARAYYSSTGSYVDISAPGGDMNVDQNNDGYKDGILQQTFSNTPSNFGYWFYQGTSMAAPHVSGIAALLISKGVTGPDAIMNVLKATAKDKGPVGWDAEYGWGIVDAYAALNYVPEVIHDVAVTGIVVVSSCVQGDTVPVTVNAGNSGNYDETFTVVLSDSTSGAEIGRQTTSLPSKGSANLVFQWDTAGAVIGDHTLKAEAQAVSGESNISNNTATSTITVKDAVHDVAITAINSPLEAGKGDSVSIPVTVKNQGAYAETTLITLTDITDNVSLGSQTLALNVDASTSVLFNWNTSSASLGNHFFRADAGVVSGETNTDNNSMVTTVGTNVKQKAMHIAGIDMALSTRISGKIKYTRALAALTLVDPGGVPVPGAVISGTWSGATRDSDTGTTNSSGKLTVSSNEVRNPARGTTYTFTVKSVTKTGWTYDSAQNTVTSKSIKVP